MTPRLRTSPDDARVLHVNDVASVASTLVATARARDLAWSLRKIPAGRGSRAPVIAWRRGTDLAGAVGQMMRQDIVHLHYGVTGYYGWFTPKPVVLHLHGTDIRTDLRSRTLGPVVRASLRRADLVLYSTPDLTEIVHDIRPDAAYLPNPVAARYFTGPGNAYGPPDGARPGGTGPGGTGPRGTGHGGAGHNAGAEAEAAILAGDQPRVVFNMRWDDSKGGRELVVAARALVVAGCDVVGIDWGTYAREAREAGVRMLPLQTAERFQALLASADVVVGQQVAGALGLADLQALALGKPLVAHASPEVPVNHSSLDSIVEVTRTILGSAADLGPDVATQSSAVDGTAAAGTTPAGAPAADAPAATSSLTAPTPECRREWVERHHSPEIVLDRLLALYATLPSTRRPGRRPR